MSKYDRQLGNLQSAIGDIYRMRMERRQLQKATNRLTELETMLSDTRTEIGELLNALGDTRSIARAIEDGKPLGFNDED